MLTYFWYLISIILQYLSKESNNQYGHFISKVFYYQNWPVKYTSLFHSHIIEWIEKVMIMKIILFHDYSSEYHCLADECYLWFNHNISLLFATLHHYLYHNGFSYDYRSVILKHSKICTWHIVKSLINH